MLQNFDFLTPTTGRTAEFPINADKPGMVTGVLESDFRTQLDGLLKRLEEAPEAIAQSDRKIVFADNPAATGTLLAPELADVDESELQALVMAQGEPDADIDIDAELTPPATTNTDKKSALTLSVEPETLLTPDQEPTPNVGPDIPTPAVSASPGNKTAAGITPVDAADGDDATSDDPADTRIAKDGIPVAPGNVPVLSTEPTGDKKPLILKDLPTTEAGKAAAGNGSAIPVNLAQSGPVAANAVQADPDLPGNKEPGSTVAAADRPEAGSAAPVTTANTGAESVIAKDATTGAVTVSAGDGKVRQASVVPTEHRQLTSATDNADAPGGHKDSVIPANPETHRQGHHQDRTDTGNPGRQYSDAMAAQPRGKTGDALPPGGNILPPAANADSSGHEQDGHGPDLVTGMQQNPATQGLFRPAMSPARDAGATTNSQHVLLHSSHVAGSPAWQDEFAGQVRWLGKNGISSAEISLKPAELGHIEIRIVTRDDHTSVSFLTSTPAARDNIESSLPRLRELLASTGLQVADTTVSHQQAGDSGNRGNRPVFTNTNSNVVTPVEDQDISPAPGQVIVQHGRGNVDYYV